MDDHKGVYKELSKLRDENEELKRILYILIDGLRQTSKLSYVLMSSIKDVEKKLDKKGD